MKKKKKNQYLKNKNLSVLPTTWGHNQLPSLVIYLYDPLLPISLVSSHAVCHTCALCCNKCTVSPWLWTFVHVILSGTPAHLSTPYLTPLLLFFSATNSSCVCIYQEFPPPRSPPPHLQTKLDATVQYVPLSQWYPRIVSMSRFMTRLWAS